MATIITVILIIISIISSFIVTYEVIFDEYYGKGGKYRYPYNYIIWIVSGIGGSIIGLVFFLIWIMVSSGEFMEKLKKKKDE